MAHHHEIRVRYGEVDLQGVVFNAHYLAYVDDAMTAWVRDLERYPFRELGWDFMVRHAEIDWVGSATVEDLLEIECTVQRWGRTSFDVRYDLHVGDRGVATVTITYVGVRMGTTETMAPPSAFRAHLGEPG